LGGLGRIEREGTERVSDQLAETRRLLEFEYHHVRTRLDQLENLRFRVKEWAISISGILIALGINAGQQSVVLLCIPVALVLAMVEADYLARLQALDARSNELEGTIEAIRRDPSSIEAEAYVFGMRAVPPARQTVKGFAEMFGGQSRAGFAYVLIVIGALVAAATI
jgi:hypothetical protein